VGTARSICKMPAIVVALVLLVCSGLSAWGLFSGFWPGVETFLRLAVDKYDALLPAITIQGGKASIHEQQPHFIDLGDKDLVAVIDTREGKEKDAQDYLKDATAGAVLTRESIVTKSQGQLRIIPLQGAPDLVINSSNVRAILNEYLPLASRLVLLAVILYFVFIKPLQAIIFALLPYFAARSYSVALTYGESVKIAAVVMVPPVALDLFLHLSGIQIPVAFVFYFGLYIALLILAVRDLVHSKPLEAGPSTTINP
jgi:hypothetical protein